MILYQGEFLQWERFIPAKIQLYEKIGGKEKMTKMKKILAAVLASAMVLSFAACGEKETPAAKDKATASETVSTAAETTDSAQEAGEPKYAASGKLTMATNASFPPYEYYDNETIVGIDAEVAALIADKLGVELEIKDMEFGSIIGAVQTGAVDMGMAGMTVTEDRLKTVDFSDSYATAVQVIIVNEGSEIASADDLQGKKVGVQENTTGDIYASDDLGEDSVKRYNKGNDAVAALVSGVVDAVIIDNEPAKSFVAANEGLKILDTSYADEQYAIAVSKDNAGLTAAINKALAELKADGTLDSIVEKYIPAE